MGGLHDEQPRFYEWHKPQGRKGPKQPYMIRFPKDERLLTLACLYDHWHGDDGV